MIDVTIIIPVYNADEFILTCLTSVFLSINNDDEVIIIDDGSTDNTAKICTDFIKSHPSFKYFHKENGGVSSARNLGLKHAQGKYIGFVDADDNVDVTYRDCLVRLIADSDLAVCGFNRIFDLTQIKLSENLDQATQATDVRLEKNEIINQVINNSQVQGFLWNKLFKKDIIQNNEITFHEGIHICEDLLFCISYINFCDYVNVTNAKIYNYLDNPASALNCSFNPKHLSLARAFENINTLPCMTQSSQSLANLEISMLLALLKKYFKARDLKDDGFYLYFKEITSAINKVKSRVSFGKMSIKFKLAFLLYMLNPKLFILFRFF